MKGIVLGLSQVLAVAWVWQQEVTPKYLPIWKERGPRCGTIRRPEKHVEAYNSLLDQLLSSEKEIKYTKGALCFFVRVSSQMINAFFRQDSYPQKMPGLISAERQLMKPQEEDLAEARSIIRAMMSVDSMGNPLYEPFPPMVVLPLRK